MLQGFRKMASSWVAKVLFAVLLGSFVLWGIGDIFRRGFSIWGKPAIQVGTVKLDRTYVENAFRNETAIMSKKLEGLSPAQQKALRPNIMGSTVNRLIDKYTTIQLANEFGLTVSDKLLVREISKAPAFRGADKKFNPELFAEMLRTYRMSEGEFLEAMREQLTHSLVLGAFKQVDYVPAKMAADIAIAKRERRIADFMEIPFASAKTEKPKAEQLEEFYKANIQKYSLPEYRSYSVIRLKPAELAKEVTVTDGEVAAAYEENSSAFRVPETRDISQVLVETEEAAQKVYDLTKKEGSLTAAAKTLNIKIDEISAASKESLPTEVADTVFNLPPNGISTPVESPLGWHVFQVTKVTPPSVRPLAEVRADLLKTLYEEKANRMVDDTLKRMEDALAAGTPAMTVAKDLKLPLITVYNVDANGLSKDTGKPLKSQTDLPEGIQEVAFSMAQGESSAPIEDAKTNAVYVVYVDSISPATPQAFETVKGRIAGDWTQRAQKTAAVSMADDITRKANETKSTPVLGKATPPLSRADIGKNRDFSDLFIINLFNLKPGQTISFVDKDKAIVMRLRQIIRPNASEVSQADIQSEQQEIYKSLSIGFADQFLKAVRKKFPVTLDEEFLRNMATSSEQ